VRALVEEVLPQVAREHLALMADVFCDQGAFTVEEAEVLLTSAKGCGLGVRLHAEQIARTGASQLAARLRALSADHLEMATLEDLSSLAEAGVVAVLLPGAALSLKKPLPQAALLRQAGVRVALASDHNPGTSPLLNPWLTMALAVHVVGLGAEEALVAHTAHAALALGRPELGRLEPGAMADFVALEAPPLDPIYRYGEHPPLAVYIGGERVWF
jgi:imidazolonepropionase